MLQGKQTLGVRQAEGRQSQWVLGRTLPEVKLPGHICPELAGCCSSSTSPRFSTHLNHIPGILVLWTVHCSLDSYRYVHSNN